MSTKCMVLTVPLTLAAFAQTSIPVVTPAGYVTTPFTDISKDNPQTVTRTVEIPGHFYVVQYLVYFNGVASVPATSPPGEPHYDATVTVFEVINGTRKPVGESFSGQYTSKGCFEDKPETLIARALTTAKSLTPEIEAAFKKREEDDRYAAFPLYEEIDGVIAVTEKGSKLLKSITVNGKVVWRPGEP